VKPRHGVAAGVGQADRTGLAEAERADPRGGRQREAGVAPVLGRNR